MRVTYFNRALQMFVVEAAEGSFGTAPVVLCNLDSFENDENVGSDPVKQELANFLAPDHAVYFTNKKNGFTYIASRGGVTITFAQVVSFEDHSHADVYVLEALQAVIAYEEASK